MTTLHVEIDDTVADEIRKKAEAAGKTPEVWAAELVAQQVSLPANKEWIAKFLESAKTSGGDSKGWKWNREELYER